MAAISLSSLVHSNDIRREGPSLVAPPPASLMAPPLSSSQRRSRRSSPQRSPRQSPRQSPRHVPRHTPLPTSTNYPTSVYHRPTSPIPRPISPCPRPISPCGRAKSPRPPQSPDDNDGPRFIFDATSAHSEEAGHVQGFDDEGLTSLGFHHESPQQSLAPPTLNDNNNNDSSSLDRKGITQQRKNLQCSVCLKNYQDPRLLPCFHSFCANCLESSCLQKGKRKGKPDSVYCPICTETTELTSKGIQGLPKNMYMEHLVDLQSSAFKTKVNCDLCVGSEVATNRCKDCECNLCEFCTQAHRKQRKTSYHSLMSVEEENGSSSSDVGLAGSGRSSNCASRKASSTSRMVLTCKEHAKEILDFYCEDCEVLICHKCISESHAHHRRSSLQEANEQYSELLHGLLSKAHPLAGSISEAIKNISFVSISIQERSKTISVEIIEFVSSQMKALQEHKRLLLLQLEAVKNQKVSTLDLQLEELKKALRELEANSEEAQKVLDQGIPSLAFGAGNVTATRLEELIVGKYELSPTEDDYIEFHSHLQMQETNGLPIYGVLDSKGPSAAQTIAEGEGLYEARLGKSAKFNVVVCDRYKQQREVGGDRVEASMVGKKGEIVYMFIKDCEDGVYEISYIPGSTGEHKLSILVDEKHIKGSPFVVRVYPKRSKHNGIFHCCTYCSSGGKKHIRCGCGSAMPGGYSGCGHGHPGHPGCRHWSCCGNNAEISECL